MARFLTLAFILLFAFAALARQSAKASSDLPPSQIFNRARPSVVVIVADDRNSQREALGSGFVVSRDRIATNHHVVEGMKEAYVLFSDGAIKRVSGIAADSVQQDLIILKVETDNRPSLPFGDELSLQQGDPVYALGAPKGLELSFTNGIVSSFRKSDAQFLIQTTAPIAPGSSGGPLFDRAGRVVGVTTSMLTDTPGIYFSVGIGDVMRMLRMPQGVALPFDDWASQQSIGRPSDSPSSRVAPRQSQEGQAATPSLQDTLSWMESFSETHGLRIVNGVGITHTNTLHDSPDLACLVIIMHKSPKAPDGSEQSAIEFINLRDVDPDSVRADENGNVELQSTDPSGKFDRVGDWGTKMGRLESLRSLDFLTFDSRESAQRFATALKHAVTLCGGAKSPF